MEGATDELEGVRHFRQGRGRREQRTTTLELFFDLVFVFAVTQLSHALVDDLTWAGAARTLFLLLLVWWGWNYTTWMTNFADPESVPVRLMLIGAMLASLLMAVAIPEAFGDRAVLFAVSYVALQVIRNAVIAWISPPGTGARDTFAAILAWSLIAGALLIAGAFLPYDARVVVWIAALAFDYAGPALRYRLPGMRRVTTDQWAVERRALLGALPALHHHRPRRVDRGHRGDRRPTSASTPPGSRRSRSPSSGRPRSGGSTSTTSPRSPGGAWRPPATPAGWPATRSRTSTSRSSRASS